MMGIGKDPLCFWIADPNKATNTPREVKDFRTCALRGEKCPVVHDGECFLPEARRLGKYFDAYNFYVVTDQLRRLCRDDTHKTSDR